MNKIILFRLASVETQYLKTLVQSDPTIKFFPAENVLSLKTIREKLGWIDLVLVGCGRENKEENIEKTSQFLEEIKLYWPEAKIVLVSTFQNIIEKTGRKNSDRVMAQLNLSVKTGLKPAEIVKILDESLTSEESPTFLKLRIKNVLIVDDEENILKTIKLLLGASDRYRVWTAADPNKAFKILQENKDVIECIIVDYNLGTETADRLIKSAKELNSKFKIFILTCEGKNKKPPWGPEIEALIEGVLEKPFNIDEIVLAINSIYKPRQTVVKWSRPKVLVIDDISETYKLLNDILGQQLEIETAFDGETGLIKSAEFKPDLVVIDYRLPGKNGLEVWKEIRRMNPGQRAIIVTIDRNPEVATAFAQEGNPKILYKPIDPREMNKIVKEELGEKET